MRPYLILFILLIAESAYAQYKKAPDLYNRQPKINKQIRAGGYKGFDVVELTKTGKGTWDTIATNYYTYYSNGLIQQVVHYDYYGSDEKHELIPKATPISKLERGYRSTFYYDAHNNLVRKERNDLLPKNSYLGFLFRLSKNYKRPEDRYGSSDSAQEQINADSILAAGFPEEERPTDLEIYTYNEDGNLLRMYDSIRRTTENYSYSYNANLEVVEQRKFSNVGATGVWEYLYAYNKQGDLDSITIYRSSRDTSQVVKAENLEYRSSRKYNKKHRLIAFVDLNYDGGFKSYSTTKNVYTYRYDTLIASVAVLNGNNDTTALILNSYNKNGKPILQLKYTFEEGKRKLNQKQSYVYDSDNYIKTTTYCKFGEGSGDEILYKEERYFMRK